MSLIPKIGLPKGRAGQFIVDGVADGYEAFALVQAIHEIAPDKPVLFVARDGQRLPAITEALTFASPGLPVLELPAWDCLPYDRVSPGSDAAAKRLDALTAMIALAKKPHRAVILTTANALLQRIPPADLVEAQTFHARPGNQIDIGASTPLCPAGHLPLKRGDWMARLLSPVSNVARRAVRPRLLISPLEGEMSGRTEGGETGRPHSAVSYE